MHKVRVLSEEIVDLSDIKVNQAFSWGQRRIWYIKLSDDTFLNLAELKIVEPSNFPMTMDKFVIGHVSEIVIGQ